MVDVGKKEKEEEEVEKVRVLETPYVVEQWWKLRFMGMSVREEGGGGGGGGALHLVLTNFESRAQPVGEAFVMVVGLDAAGGGGGGGVAKRFDLPPELRLGGEEELFSAFWCGKSLYVAAKRRRTVGKEEEEEKEEEEKGEEEKGEKEGEEKGEKKKGEEEEEEKGILNVVIYSSSSAGDFADWTEVLSFRDESFTQVHLDWLGLVAESECSVTCYRVLGDREFKGWKAGAQSS